MRLRDTALVLLGACLLLATGPARAATPAEYDAWAQTCANEATDADARITACTAALQSQIAGNEDAAILLIHRGMARAERKEYQAALEDYDAALGRDPNADLAYFQAGVVHDELGQYDKAIRAYDNALRLNPNDAPTLNNRCWVRVLAFDPQWALPDCLESLRLEPNDPDTLDTTGFAYLLLGRVGEAIASFDAAIAARARQPTAFYGRALARLGTDRAAAAADLAQARRIDPDIDAKFRRWGLPADNPPCMWPGACARP